MRSNEYNEKLQRLRKKLAISTEQIRRDNDRIKQQVVQRHLNFQKYRTALLIQVGEMYCDFVGQQISESEYQKQGDDYFKNLSDFFTLMLKA